MNVDTKAVAENWVTHQKAEVARIEAAIAELQDELGHETRKLAMAEQELADLS